MLSKPADRPDQDCVLISIGEFGGCAFISDDYGHWSITCLYGAQAAM